MAQHISIRVPWKDNGYSGFICEKPCYNNSCLCLKNIAENRNDKLEQELAGKPMAECENDLPCISEGGAFMSPVNHKNVTEHPYKKSSKQHSHFFRTDLIYPPFSLPARPFGWTMLRKGNEQNNDNIMHLSQMYNIDYDQEREPKLGFDTNWIQDAINQRAIFKAFYQDVIPKKSLVIPYAKQVPFIEDVKKRVIMGIGFINSLKEPPDHNCKKDEGSLRSILWETMTEHTIRNDRKDGFLLPYREMMAYAEANPEFDIRSVTVFAEDDYFDEFSYATEHLSHDAVISVLLQTVKALNIVKQCISGNWDECITWVNARLAEVWQDRGTFPGAGMLLYAMGFKCGLLIANEVKNTLADGESFAKKLEQVVSQPNKHLSAEIAVSIDKTMQNTFINLSKERKNIFWLLARFSLTLKQAQALFLRQYNHIDSKGKIRVKEIRIDCSDAEMLKNPYLIFERTRLIASEYQVPLRKVDMAVFPSQKVRQSDPLPEDTRIVFENDERRIRAVAISILENQTDNGHTVYPQNKLIADINEFQLDTPCNVNADILNSLACFFSDEFVPLDIKNGGTAYQLIRMKEFDDVIRNSINKRLNAPKRHEINEDWNKIVNEAFSKTELDDSEKRARQEKAAVLKELAESRLSVLIGGAGTGKTTLLALLCKSPQIQNGGVLLLAPTGKARVRMSQAMDLQNVRFKAKTVAQFLIQNGRFDFATMRYRLSDTDADSVPNTVIIDESSMLTEEMFAALLQALKKNAQRIIFVGDPKQLPPIGAGRPFVDLVKYLKKDLRTFPSVGKSYGELTVTRRQQNLDGSERFDTMLAEWYADNDIELDDEIFVKLQANQCGKNISFKTWKTSDELEKLILETVAEEVKMNGVEDQSGFDRSLGGKVTDKGTYFNAGETKAEGWQILAPIRNQPHGVINLNMLFHNNYRAKFTELAKKGASKLIPEPMGAERIVYGDKVINITNKKDRAYYDWSKKESDKGYVANGEVGIAIAGINGKLQVEFGTQPKLAYQYKFGGDEGESPLELAYALTVHKSQGSEFETVILVLGEPCGLLSKELLYTAITRQKDKLVILYNNEAYHLRNYASSAYSDIARRFTNLFESPEIVEYKRQFYENGLVHRTARGELVRSKSEVIIANGLFSKKIEYAYEKELDLGEDGVKLPDFTIEDAESGAVFYWEHCGMMNDATYKARWEIKRKIYEKHGIVEGQNLIVSDETKGIDSQVINNLISKYFS